MRFFAEESCQKCTPCRIGTRALEHVLHELEHDRQAIPGGEFEEWLVAMEKGSICGLGQGRRRFPPRRDATWFRRATSAST